MTNYGLIGKSLGHSFSKKFFEHRFNDLKIIATYCNYELQDISEIIELVRNNTDLAGLNVTIPYKESVISFLDEIDPVAKQIGAVNTIKIKRGANNFITLKGYNTDAYGFQQSIKPFLKSHHERALILGTGGASKAVQYVLENLGVAVVFVSRKPNKKANHITYQDLNEYVMSSHLMIVNTTPVGTFPNVDEAPEIHYELLTNKHFLVDLVYNPKETLFINKGFKNGANVINGLTMLEQQALKSWEIWDEGDF